MALKGLLFVQLLYVVNQIHFPFETGIPGVVPANVMFVVVLLMMRGRPDAIQGPSTLRRPLLYFFAALVFAFLWAQLTRPRGNLLADLTYLKNAMFFPLFYFVYLRCRQDEKTTRQLIIGVMVIAAVAGLEAIKEGVDYGYDSYNPGKRASGPFGMDYGGANRAGVFYSMFMPMFVALLLFLRGQRIWRLGAIVGCAVLAGATLFTYSRQSYFLVLLSTAVLLLRKNLIVAGVVGGLLVSLSGFLPDSVFQRVEETKQTTSSGETEFDDSTESRWEIWEGGMYMLAANPLGVGLGRFPDEIGNFSAHKRRDAHNYYVLTVAECGPQGLITLLLVIWTLFRLTGILRKSVAPDDAETRALTIGFTVTTICMALGNIYGSPFHEGAVMTPYWALAGLLERYVQLKRRSTSADGTQPVPPSLVDRFPLAAYSRPRPRP